MNAKYLVGILISAFSLANVSFAETGNNPASVVENGWPRIGVIDEGTTWDIEVTPIGSDETLEVSQTIEDMQVIGDKEYYKLMSSVNNGEKKLIVYLYIDGYARTIHALDPNNIAAGDKLIYSFKEAECTVSSINWKGEISDGLFMLESNRETGPFETHNPNIQTGWREYDVYSTSGDEKGDLLGHIRLVDGIGNVTGLLNQCYCLNNEDEVVLKKVRSLGDGIIYDADLADVKQIESSEEKRVSAIYDIRGVQIPDFEPGLNIVRYSDGTVVKVMK